MKRNLLTLLGISMLSLVFITMNSGCSDKLRDAEEHYDIGTMHWEQGSLMMLSKNLKRQ